MNRKKCRKMNRKKCRKMNRKKCRKMNRKKGVIFDEIFFFKNGLLHNMYRGFDENDTGFSIGKRIFESRL